MKKLTFTLMLMVFGFGLFAAPVSKEAAQKIAVNFYKHYAVNKTDYSVADVVTQQYNGLTTFYIFIFNSGGFAMVAADDAVIPILGFSADEPFDKNNTPPNAEAWFNSQYSEQIEYIVNSKLDNTQTLQEWDKIRNNQFPSSKFAVAPLCTTIWDQGHYYNALCPAAPSGPGGHVYAGCVATAMAQVMKKWNYPTTGIGSHTYTDPTYGPQTANFGATTYNWTSMPNNVTSANTAVATLMYHCGVSVDMQYGAGGSSAPLIPVSASFINYFGYQNTAQLKLKSNYTTANWINLLKAELDASRPMVYGGVDAGMGGHAFVCDGYNASDQFHFNWGWSGSYNGYFTIGDLSPSSYNFSQQNQAVIGISAPTSSAPVANFTANATSVAPGTTVNFTDQSTNTPTSWSWALTPNTGFSYTGGTSQTSQNPKITFNTVGTYTVALTATNAVGNNTCTKNNYITVTNNPPPQGCDSLVPSSFSGTCVDSLAIYYVGNSAPWDSGFVTGQNAYHFPELAQKYAATANGTISDVIVLYGLKAGSGNTSVKIYTDNGGLPGTLLGTSATIAKSAIDTSNSGGNFNNVYHFSTPVSAAADYYVSVNLPTTFTSQTDELAIIGENVTCSANSTYGGYLKYNGTWLAFASQSAFGINIDMMILPVVCTVVGENDIITDNNIFIYPNPASNVFTIDFSGNQQKDAVVSVYNTMGKLVKNISLNSITDKMLIDMSSETTGIYIVNIKTDQGTIIKKLSLIK